jgi:hypothetical protein
VGREAMSKLTIGILGAIALSLSFGAAQFALGRDLPEAPLTPADGINRAAKADRIANVMGSPARTQTISLRTDRFSGTSFLVRVPVAREDGNPSSPARTKPAAGRKQMVACEPVVSLLTEVARLLQPGRCVT